MFVIPRVEEVGHIGPVFRISTPALVVNPPMPHYPDPGIF